MKLLPNVPVISANHYVPCGRIPAFRIAEPRGTTENEETRRWIMSWQLFWECRKGLHHRCRGRVASGDTLGQDLYCSCPHHSTGRVETVFYCFICRRRIPADEAKPGFHAHLDREAA